MFSASYSRPVLFINALTTVKEFINTSCFDIDRQEVFMKIPEPLG